MSEHIKITPGGEAVIPRDVCERLDWRPGKELVLDAGRGQIMVRAKDSSRERIDYQEFRRRVPKFEGPPKSLEDMQRGIDEAMAERWARKEANSR